MYVEIVSSRPDRDGRARRLLESCEKTAAGKITGLVIVDSYRFDTADFPEGGERGLLCDPIAQRSYRNRHAALDPSNAGWFLLAEITYRPGVTNPEAITLRNALESFLGRPIPLETAVQTARQYLFHGTPLSDAERERLVGFLYNPLIELATTAVPADFENGDPLPLYYPAAGIAGNAGTATVAGGKSGQAGILAAGGSAAEASLPGPAPPAVLRFPVASMTAAELASLSSERLLALDAREMKAIRDYYRSPEVIAARKRAGLPPEATDVEIEMIAQTWSEHCKHKIFRARITYTEEPAAGGGSRAAVGTDGGQPAAGTGGAETIDSLFSTYIKATTKQLTEEKGYLRSVFDDNSGVVDFDGENLLCFKVETHNSPSALDPYGGAITGIVGVNRDIMGTGMGARPIFNTDVLCFADPRTPEEDCPRGLLHPRTLMEGVHRGIVDGGNQSGIPVAAGAFHFDESYIGKPLVFCGTGGILPAEVNGKPGWEKSIIPGDRAVMVGGRIGKDGIHGATFSSLALDESSPVSAVQIGDPITQKKMADFLLEARDLGLYRWITDNGAGGLSSSLGEMAQASGGVRIDLSACPLKYQGLSPWEILVSESQERMSLAVPPEAMDRLLALAVRRGVEATDVGVFTDTGSMEITYAGQTVGSVTLAFLHDGNPVMDLRAVWVPPEVRSCKPGERTDTLPGAFPPARFGGRQGETGAGGDIARGPAGPADSGNADSLADLLSRVLSDPVVRSKEPLVRQYDHEVLAQSVVKPFAGVNADAPTDGGVIAPVYGSFRGATITHGLCPRYGDWDTRDMAMCAVDEAYRAHIALGGDPDLVSALDNFCWPDPVESPDNPDGPYKLAQLVRACRGLSEICLEYGIPLISGKDSMKNDARAGGRKISVRPTLLVSLLGIIEDVRTSGSPDFKEAGDSIYLLGESRGELGGTILERIVGGSLGSHGFGRADSRSGRGLREPDTEGSGRRDAGRPGLCPSGPCPPRFSPSGPCPSVRPKEALKLYRALHGAMKDSLVRSCHDLSDGGLAVALAESALGGDCGADVDISFSPPEWESERLLFCETPSRFLVTVRPAAAERFRSLMEGLPVVRVGTVEREPVIKLRRNGSTILEYPLSEVKKQWKIAW